MKNLEVYDAMVALCPRITRKGKTVPYTSANGYMFSLLNKEGELGIRFSKERQERLIKQHNMALFKSHNAIMKGYVLIPEALHSNLTLLAQYLNDSFDYVMTLPPK